MRASLAVWHALDSESSCHREIFSKSFCELVTCFWWSPLLSSLNRKKNATIANTTKPTINPADKIINVAKRRLRRAWEITPGQKTKMSVREVRLTLPSLELPMSRGRAVNRGGVLERFLLDQLTNVSKSPWRSCPHKFCNALQSQLCLNGDNLTVSCHSDFAESLNTYRLDFLLRFAIVHQRLEIAAFSSAGEEIGRAKKRNTLFKECADGS